MIDSIWLRAWLVLIAALMLLAAAGCHTAHGAAAGFGRDVEAAGEYVSGLGQRLQAYEPR